MKLKSINKIFYILVFIIFKIFFNNNNLIIIQLNKIGRKNLFRIIRKIFLFNKSIKHENILS